MGFTTRNHVNMFLKKNFLKEIIFFGALCCRFEVQTFDSFCFQNVLSNGDGDSKNDKGQSTNQLSRIYVGVI